MISKVRPMTAEVRTAGWLYFLLAARLLLAGMLLSYGVAKLAGLQFGVSDATMQMALKDIDLFRLSWYLADHEPFRSFVGVSQIVTAVLLLYPRTVLIGAFVSIPIWLNILIWDLTFMGDGADVFTVRLSVYLALTGLIIGQERPNVVPALRRMLLTRSLGNYPVWAYLLLPVIAVLIELMGGLLNWGIQSVF
ncbi:hypothetical protein CLV58_101246 [Spirosoma oryzae]|uniref:DoxX-like protein n=1 Tax=Spirosoma oryzae TaxID=1469603 RepID=A0A2T0TN90_9BACT|nr:hypothetical protein [Spirosoma oryzae]PRY47180.1 hypothetical protein CLV58_101246 [Spirosoma oryzae]